METSWSQPLPLSVQFSRHSCLILCNPDCSTFRFPVHHRSPGALSSHVHRVSDIILTIFHPLSSPHLLPSVFPTLFTLLFCGHLALFPVLQPASSYIYIFLLLVFPSAKGQLPQMASQDCPNPVIFHTYCFAQGEVYMFC